MGEEDRSRSSMAWGEGVNGRIVRETRGMAMLIADGNFCEQRRCRLQRSDGEGLASA